MPLQQAGNLLAVNRRQVWQWKMLARTGGMLTLQDIDRRWNRPAG